MVPERLDGNGCRVRRARYTGTHPAGTARYTFRALALDIALWACVLVCAATLLALDWTTF